MTEYQQQRTRRHHQTTADEPEARPEDQRNAELDGEVACCLAEIDELLAETESERDRAVREFGQLDDEDLRGVRVWNARYAHLGLSIGRACCTLYLWDKNASTVIDRK